MEKITKEGLLKLGFQEIITEGHSVYVKNGVIIADNGMCYLICNTSFKQLLATNASVISSMEEVEKLLNSDI